MAKQLKSIRFPGLDNVYVILEGGTSMPPVTIQNKSKFFRAIEGTPAQQTVQNAEEVDF